jgi:hypothetical protein
MKRVRDEGLQLPPLRPMTPEEILIKYADTLAAWRRVAEAIAAWRRAKKSSP